MDVSVQQELQIRAAKAESDCLRGKVRLLERKLNRSFWEMFRERIFPKSDTEHIRVGGGVSPERMSNPRIGLVIDTPEWAFANIARQLHANLGDQFEFDIVPLSLIGHDPVLALYLTKDCDLVHFLWREVPLDALHDPAFATSVDLYFGSVEKIESCIIGRATLSVYDHLYLQSEETSWRTPLFDKYCIAYTVCSRRLNDIYEKIDGYPKPSAVIQDGVDLKMFFPTSLQRLDDTSGRPLLVGWVGNSKWAGEIFDDAKGFRSVLLPALEMAAGEQLPIEGHFADRQQQFIPHEKMVSYYAEIDVLVCVSAIEGTPNPVLEAMACGVPVISTDVGVVPEVFGPLQSRFILRERTPDALLEKLREILSAPDLLRKISNENLERIKGWSWPRQAEKFRSFFLDAISRQDQAKARGAGAHLVAAGAGSRGGMGC